MQMKRRQRTRELPACLQKTSTPYLTTIHASRKKIRLSEPQRSVRSVCQSVFTHKFTFPIGKGKKMTGCMFSRLSHVHGPVENYAQIPKGIFVMKGGTANIKNRNFFTCGVKFTTSDLEVLTIRCLFLAYTANQLSIICIIRGSLVSKVRSPAYNMCETCTPAVQVTAPDTPSAMSNTNSRQLNHAQLPPVMHNCL